MDRLQHRRLFLGTGTAPLFLDKVQGNYAVVAFSFRRLRTAYTGNLVRLRRSSDNKEADFGWGTTGWLTASSVAANGSDPALDGVSLTSFFSGTDGFIVKRYDQSQYSRNAEQSTAANQPQLVSSGALLLGSGNRPATTYDGVDDYLVTAGFAVAQPLTAAIVLHQISHIGIGEAVLDSDSTGSRMLLSQYSASPALSLYAGNWPPTPENSGLALGVWGLVTGVWNAGSSTIQVNSGADNSGNPGAGGIVSGFSIGATTAGTAAVNFKESEVIVWPLALSTAQRTEQRADQREAYTLY